MTEQKHEDTATAEGMPEAPPVDNAHVAPGAEQFDDTRPLSYSWPGARTQVSPQSVTAVEVAVQHMESRVQLLENANRIHHSPDNASLESRVHALENAFMGYLSHDQHNHPAVQAWTERMQAKINKAKQVIRDTLASIGSHPTSLNSGENASKNSPTK